MRRSLIITAYGHQNIRATHRSTWQLTKEDHVTTKGDCIIGIEADYSTSDFPDWLKDHLRGGGSIKFSFEIDGIIVEGEAKGSESLTLDDPIDIVFRKSEYSSPRTGAIESTIVAQDLSEIIVKKIQNPRTKIILTIKTV